MLRLEAGVFDVDGTIIDSNEYIGQAYQSVCAKYGICPTEAQVRSTIGKPVDVTYGILAPHLDSSQLVEEHFRHHDLNRHLLRSFPETVPTLDALTEQGLKLGVFTGADGEAIRNLTHFGLLEYFGSIAYHGRYSQPKPDPEGLELCLNELEVEPANSFYIGDGINDVLAGRAAGVGLVIGITHGFGTAEDLEAGGADYIIDSLVDLPGLVRQVGAQIVPAPTV